MKTISIKLPHEMDARLTAVANRTGKSKSEVTRQALEGFFRHGPQKRAVSAYDLARDLIGKFQGGPRDLSTNPKYLRGYGR